MFGMEWLGATAAGGNALAIDKLASAQQAEKQWSRNAATQATPMHLRGWQCICIAAVAPWRSSAQTVEMLTWATKQRSTMASDLLGWCHEAGIDVRRNDTEANMWCQHGAWENHQRSLQGLARMVARGLAPRGELDRALASSRHSQGIRKTMARSAIKAEAEAETPE